MTTDDLLDPKFWSKSFGLADTPLFGRFEHAEPEQHWVMLDGGHGTFALSVTAEADFDSAAVASWVWSSDVPHHVAVSRDRVAVTRWDKPREPRKFTLRSVSQNFDSFYRFLVKDRVEQGQNVVTHLIEQFRSVRTAVNQTGEDDSLSLGVFLALLGELVHEALGPHAAISDHFPDIIDQPIDPAAQALFERLRGRQLAPLIERVHRRQFTSADLELFSTLAIRHAGGLIFQEAHFELMRAPSPNLFGFLDAPTLKPITRGGAHFTPPALARSVVEQTLTQIEDIAERQEVVLADPACGSGAFLHEALRALQRTGFNGQLRLVGRDISEHAIAMARFVLARAASDWRPAGGITCDIKAADSLAEGSLPEADIIVMNPPFIAVGSLNKTQQEHIDRILGKLKRGRPDLSMAFVLKAIERLRPQGALGCLLPASLLELRAAGPWRQALQERAPLRFIGSLGDHGLFAYAIVQVAAAVFKKAPAERDDHLLTLWTSGDKEATGEALRSVRSIAAKGPGAAEEHPTWRLAWLPRAQFQASTSWKLRTPRAEQLLEEVRQVTSSSVGDLFDVHQGILTGCNEAFIISHEEWQVLPKSEQSFFLPAVMNRTIDNGRLSISSYVFYPYLPETAVIETEEDLTRHIPVFYERNLRPRKDMLAARPSIMRSGTRHWWQLTRRRSWMEQRKPRIISKYFGAIGGFVPDIEARVAVVQGYAWYPKERLSPLREPMPHRLDIGAIVRAYAALLNSRVFARLLSAFAPRVAGGQFNLSSRYVRPVPMPDLVQAAIDQIQTAAVAELAALGSEIAVEDEQWMARADSLSAQLYAVPVNFWK